MTGSEMTVYADGIIEEETMNLGANFSITYFRWERDVDGEPIKVPVLTVIRPISSIASPDWMDMLRKMADMSRPRVKMHA